MNTMKTLKVSDAESKEPVHGVDVRLLYNARAYKVINGKVYSILESVNKDKFCSPNIRGNGTDVDLFTNLL